MGGILMKEIIINDWIKTYLIGAMSKTSAKDGGSGWRLPLQIELESRIDETNNPIFVLGCHKSGTSLLRSIFDGHPDLFVIPREGHFFENLKWWVRYPLRGTEPSGMNSDDIVGSFTRFIEYLNSSANRYGAGSTYNRWDVRTFKDCFGGLDLNKLPLKKFFIMLLLMMKKSCD